MQQRKSLGCFDGFRLMLDVVRETLAWKRAKWS